MFLPQEGDSWKTEDDHFAQMIAILGDIPKSLLEKGPKSSKYFNDEGIIPCVLFFSLIAGKLHRVKEIPRMPLEDVIERKIPELEKEEAHRFISFLRPMLRFDPAERPSAADSVEHEWLQAG